MNHPLQTLRRWIGLLLLWLALLVGGEGFTDYALDSLLGNDIEDWD